MTTIVPVTVTIKEDVLRDLSRYADPTITFAGAKVKVTIHQETYDAEGWPTGAVMVSFEGHRNFGRTVTFTYPVKATVVTRDGKPVSDEDQAYFEQAAQYAVQAFAEIGTTEG